MSSEPQKTATKQRPPQISIASHISSAKSSPRTPRFAEATSVLSPLEQSKPTDEHFSQTKPVPSEQTPAQSAEIQQGQNQNQTNATSQQPADVGLSYVAKKTPRFYRIEPPRPSSFLFRHAAPKSPVRSVKTVAKPNVVLVPTIVEDEVWEKDEEQNRDDDEDLDPQDEKARTTVNIIKMVIRGVSLASSMAVIAVLAVTFAQYNSTKSLARRQNYLAWPKNAETWPQIMLLAISCVSFALSAVLLGVHVRAQKQRGRWMTKYTPFTVILFIASIIMWVVGAILLLLTKSNGGGSDLWGWSCHNGKAQHLFQDAVSYQVVCNLQEASLVLCIVEVLIEISTIVVYGFVFHRLYTRRDTGSDSDSSGSSAQGSGLYFAKMRAKLVNENSQIGSTDLDGDEDGMVTAPSRFDAPPLVTRSSSAKLRTRLSRRSKKRQSAIEQQAASDEKPDAVEQEASAESAVTPQPSDTTQQQQQPRSRPREATAPSQNQRPGRLSLQIPSSQAQQQHPQQHVYYEHMTYAYPPQNPQSAPAGGAVYSSYAMPVGVGRTLGPGGVIVGPVTPVSPIYAMGAGQEVFGIAR